MASFHPHQQTGSDSAGETAANRRRTLWYITDDFVTTGTTATVVVTVNGLSSGVGCVLYSATSLQSTIPVATASATASNQSRNIEVLSGGVILGLAATGNFNSEEGTVQTWTGLNTNVYIDGIPLFIGERITAASFTSMTAQTRTVNITMQDAFVPTVAYISLR